MYKTDRGTD